MINLREHLSKVYVLTDENIDLWHKCHLCLCGCGEETVFNTKTRNKSKTPKGQYAFFVRRHNVRVMDQSRVVKHQDRREKLEKFVTTISDRTMEPIWVGYLVREYVDRHPGETLRSVARKAKLSETHFYAICSGSHPRIYKSTYLRILDAIGEPYHPDWEKYRSLHAYKGGKNYRKVAA